MALRAVPDADMFMLLGPDGACCGIFGSPSECILQFALRPDLWPDKPAFWLGLARHGCRQPALGRLNPDLKRPVFHNLWLAETYRRYADEVQYVVVDFWFLAALVEVLDSLGFETVDLQSEARTKPSAIKIPMDEWTKERRVRRASRWRQDFCLIVDERVQRQFGVRYVQDGASLSVISA